MAFPMELENWSPSLGDQLPWFESATFDLLPQRSDDYESGLFNNEIATHCQDVTAVAWSDDCDYGYGSSSSYGVTSPLGSSPEQQHDLFTTYAPANGFAVDKYLASPVIYQQQLASPPVLELPVSPENYFADVLACPQTTPETISQSFIPVVSFPVILGSGLVLPDPPAKPEEFECAAYDRAVVPDCVVASGAEFDVEDMLFGLDDNDSDVVVDQEKLASIGPSFPTVSVDDVLSVLSPEVHPSVAVVPSSPVSSPTSDTTVSPFFFSPVASPDGISLLGFSSSPSSPGSYYAASPSSCGKAAKPPVERRQRKKEQNKTAAQRYREKKRSEHGTVLSEYDQLELRNTELRAKVDDMTKEIAYLKGLIEEICA
jgi:hypothetical protein